jgi:hypothetical protein
MTTTTTTKRFHDQIGSSSPPHPIKRCKQQQDLEAFSIMTSHGLDLRNCFNSAVADVTTSAHGNYDFSDFVAAPQQALHAPESQETVPYPFFEFLGTGTADTNIAGPIALGATSSVTDPAAQFSPDLESPSTGGVVTAAPSLPCSKAAMSRPHVTSASLSHMHAYTSAAIAAQQACEVDNDRPLTTDGDHDAGHNSDGQGSASTAAEDSESSRRQADRAARNRESSRRAREKAKGRLKALEAEVLVLRDHCRRYKVQMDTLAQQAARGQCGMCGCVMPAPGAASGHAHCGQPQQLYVQPPQDLASSIGNVHRC